MSLNILQIENLSKYFGGLAAVSNCSLKIKKGSITGIIGPNGSGKTTLFNLIAGNLKASGGKVLFNDEEVTDVPSYELFSKGILRTFQIAHEFTNLSVLENLMMVPANQSGENLMTALLKPSLVRTEELVIKQKAQDVVDFLNLKHLSNELAGNLSGGQKKLLELGRTMMVDAKLVLLDEVGAGVVRASMRVQGGRWWLSCSLSVERGRAVRHGVFRSGAEAGGSADDGGRVGLGSAGKNVKASQGGELAHPADDPLWPLLLWPVLLWSVLWCSVVGFNSPD